MAKQKTVFVGLSGGVDSSVAAALLKKEGYSVVGVFLKTWQPDFLKDQGICTQTADRRDAMRVAAHLRIPFLTIDCTDAYKKEVVDRMVEEYRLGRVPNPDVFCNREVKFGVFWREAKKRGADYIATGHYARVAIDNQLPTTHYSLLRGVDANKDQSYFLWTLTQDDLSHTLFPVGEYQKTKVRALARKFGLPTAERKDSQGVCFIGKADMKEFLTHFIMFTPGDVIDQTGNIIGTHHGAGLYTIGERHGFSAHTEGPRSEPLFVVSKDIKDNTVTVAEGNESDGTKKRNARISGTSWISLPPKSTERYTAEVRYRGRAIPARVTPTKERTYIVSLTHGEFISTGQSIVLYDDDRCLGGGMVEVAY